MYVGIQFSTVGWKDCSFPIQFSCHPHQKSVDDKCLGLLPDFQFCSIDLYVSPHAGLAWWCSGQEATYNAGNASTTQTWLCGLTVCLKLGSVSSSTLFFFLKIILAIPGPLHFHRNFRISLEKPAEILVGVRLKL